jgi:hypothetical protein
MSRENGKAGKKGRKPKELSVFLSFHFSILPAGRQVFLRRPQDKSFVTQVHIFEITNICMKKCVNSKRRENRVSFPDLLPHRDHPIPISTESYHKNPFWAP